MKNPRFHIAVAVAVGIFFLAATVAHSCIATAASHGVHEHSGIQAAGLVQTSHAAVPNENCKSVRDRLLSLAPERSQADASIIISCLNPTLGAAVLGDIQPSSAQRPPGYNGILDGQPPLYLSNAVLRV